VQRNVSENGREGGIRIDEYIYPLRVASDVDDGLEEPKRSANHVMVRDANETSFQLRKICYCFMKFDGVSPSTLETPSET